MPKIFSINPSHNFFNKKELFMNHLVHIHPNKMGWLSGKMGIYWLWLGHYFFTIMFQKYWGEIVLTATTLINKLPSQTLGSYSPLQLLSNYFPDLRISSCWKPKIFRCVSFMHVHNPHRGKLDHRALKCIFIGYSSSQKGYKCYHPPSKRFLVSADVTFVENSPYVYHSHDN